MTARRDQLARRVREAPDVERLLLSESGLPGPRANLELAQAAADVLSVPECRRLAGAGEEYLALVGAIGLGRHEAVEDLRRLANDPRWRVREGVAMGLQRIGARSMERLFEIAGDWQSGTRLEQRAAAAGVCEPPLLTDAEKGERALRLLDQITSTLPGASDRKDEDYKTLRKALGYCWSVAAAAAPEVAAPMITRWLTGADPDVAWVMRENLKKNRMKKVRELLEY